MEIRETRHGEPLGVAISCLSRARSKATWRSGKRVIASLLAWQTHKRVIPSEARNPRFYCERHKRRLLRRKAPRNDSVGLLRRKATWRSHGKCVIAILLAWQTHKRVIPSEARNPRFYCERHKRRLLRRKAPRNDRVIATLVFKLMPNQKNAGTHTVCVPRFVPDLRNDRVIATLVLKLMPCREY